MDGFRPRTQKNQKKKKIKKMSLGKNAPNKIITLIK